MSWDHCKSIDKIINHFMHFSLIHFNILLFLILLTLSGILRIYNDIWRVINEVIKVYIITIIKGISIYHLGMPSPAEWEAVESSSGHRMLMRWTAAALQTTNSCMLQANKCKVSEKIRSCENE